MNNLFLVIACVLSIISTDIYAQHNPLDKSLWKIRTLNQNGAIVLHKAKYTPNPGSKNDYVLFDSTRFTSNIISIPGCQLMESGSYSLTGGNKIEFMGMDASANPECQNLYSLSGKYKFSIDGDLLVLRAIEEDTDNNEDSEDIADEEEDEEEDDSEDE